nr:PREDICTED: uncharacterized protein LOC105662700 isoform X1 [Megachile rotundata]
MNKACDQPSGCSEAPRSQQIHSWAKEAEEAERLEKMLKIENEENAAANNLALAIQSRNEARASQSDKFFDSLIDKYAKKAEKTTKKKATPAKTVKSPKNTKKTKKKA